MYSCFQHSFILLLCVNVKAIPFENYFSLEQSYHFPAKKKIKWRKVKASQYYWSNEIWLCSWWASIHKYFSKAAFSLTDSVSTFSGFPITIIRFKVRGFSCILKRLKLNFIVIPTVLYKACFDKEQKWWNHIKMFKTLGCEIHKSKVNSCWCVLTRRNPSKDV